MKQDEIYGVFCGMIDQSTTARIINQMAIMSQHPGCKKVHILFQTTGGMVQDGICLYNFFKTYPVELNLYNVGTISSIGVIAYLGAHRRVVNAHANFMLHRAHASPAFATAVKLEMAAKSLLTDDERIEGILRSAVTMTDAMWTTHNGNDLWLTAPEAVNSGIAHEIGDFAPPAGQYIISLI